MGSSQQLLCSSLLLVVVTGWLLTCPPLPDVFVLPHSFTGCHGHCLQGEQLTAAFVISYNTTCIPRTILRSISRQCRAERSTFAFFCHAQRLA